MKERREADEVAALRKESKQARRHSAAAGRQSKARSRNTHQQDHRNGNGRPCRRHADHELDGADNGNDSAKGGLQDPQQEVFRKNRRSSCVGHAPEHSRPEARLQGLKPQTRRQPPRQSFTTGSGVCRKKKLGDRWFEVAAEQVQRHLYSALLIAHVKPNMEEVDLAAHKRTAGRPGGNEGIRPGRNVGLRKGRRSAAEVRICVSALRQTPALAG